MILRRLPGTVFRRAERTFLPRGDRLPADLRADLWDAFRRPEVRAFIAKMCAGYQGTLPRLPELSGLTVDLLPFPVHYTSFELSLNVLPVDGDLLLSLEYRTELFDAATMETWLRLYYELLRALMSDVS